MIRPEPFCLFVLHGSSHQVQRGKEVYMVQRRAAGEFSDPFVESRRLNAMAATPQRAGGKDGRVVVSTPPQHYGTVQGTPGQGAEGVIPTMTVSSLPLTPMPGLCRPDFILLM